MTLILMNKANFKNKLIKHYLLIALINYFTPTVHGWVVWPSWCLWLGKNFWPLTISIVPRERACLQQSRSDSIYPFIINLCSKIFTIFKIGAWNIKFDLLSMKRRTLIMLLDMILPLLELNFEHENWTRTIFFSNSFKREGRGLRNKEIDQVLYF